MSDPSSSTPALPTSTARPVLCENPDPASTLTERLNQRLSEGGEFYRLLLCNGRRYTITRPLAFAALGQEISTEGYPWGRGRATLVVAGPVADGKGHTTAVDGTCDNCDYIRLLNVQIDGARDGHSAIQGGANIEMGGNNTHQVVEYVRSYNPRSRSCLHVSGGPFNCSSISIAQNDIGPCGSDTSQELADGITISCADSTVNDNRIVDATDGGIVISGSPRSRIVRNKISVENATGLGGITMVGHDPWSGNYTDVIVQSNTILGGFAPYHDPPETKGENRHHAIIKIGIAIGPRTWFGDWYLKNVSFSGAVLNNRLSGAFGYGIAVTSAHNFTVQDNGLFGGTSFIGSPGPQCADYNTVPMPGPFVVDMNNTENLSLQDSFVEISDGDLLTCILPPNGGDYWPLSSQNDDNTGGGISKLGKAGIGLGVFFGLCIIAIVSYRIRGLALKRRQRGQGRLIKFIQNP